MYASNGLPCGPMQLVDTSRPWRCRKKRDLLRRGEEEMTKEDNV